MSTNEAGPSSLSASAAHTPVTKVEEFKIVVPKNTGKLFNVMRFNEMYKIDFNKWSNVNMKRQNDEIPENLSKFGAGSEYVGTERMEVRRKKIMTSKSSKPEDQPWTLTLGNNVKKFKGTRSDGVSDNTAYYVFAQVADGVVEAYPLNEWYNFQEIDRPKKLSAQEAQRKFAKRKMNEVSEDSDDGDEKSTEREYISDSKINNELKEVAEEKGHIILLSEDNTNFEENNQESKGEDNDNVQATQRKRKRDANNKRSVDVLRAEFDTENEPSNKTKKNVPTLSTSTGLTIGASTSNKIIPDPSMCTYQASTSQPPIKTKLNVKNECLITKELVQKYLKRKPMTTTELLSKFKSKKMGVTKDRLVEIIAEILKKTDYIKKTINDKTYLSIPD